MEFNRKDVMGNLGAVAEKYIGTLDQHKYLQACLQWLDTQLAKAEELEEKLIPR